MRFRIGLFLILVSSLVTQRPAAAVDLPLASEGTVAPPSDVDCVTLKIGRGAQPPLIPLKVFGRRLTFHVNTGSPVTALDLRWKKFLEDSLKIPGNDAADEGRGPEQVPSLTLELDRLKLSTKSVMIVDLSEARKDCGTNVDGILGMDVLRSQIVNFDFDEGRLEFRTSLPADPGEKIGLDMESGVPFVHLKVADKTLPVWIATSCNAPLVLERQAFDRFEKRSDIRNTVTSNGGASTTGYFEEIALGSFRNSDILALVGGADAVGLGYLSRFVVTFDFPNRTMWLKKGERFDHVDHSGESGIFLRRELGSTMVDWVRPGSDAWDAGLLAEDELLAINGRNIRSLTIPEAYRSIEQQKGPMELTVLREGKSMDVNLRAAAEEPEVTADWDTGRIRIASASVTLSGDARPAPLKDLTIEIKKPLAPIMVPVQLGELPTMQFMLDTGFSVTGVNSRHASRLGKQLSSKVIGTPYGRITIERFRSPPLSIAGVPTSPEGIMLSTDLSWFEKKLGVDIDGCVGFDALRSSIVQFDWTNDCVRFLPALPDDPGTGLPIRISATGVPMVQCAVGSLPDEWFAIDTGFCGETGIMAPQAVVDQLKEDGEFTRSGKTYNPEYPEWSSDSGTVASITLGTFQDRHLNMMSGEWHALGLGYLSRFTMTLDIPGRVLYLKRRKSP